MQTFIMFSLNILIAKARKYHLRNYFFFSKFILVDQLLLTLKIFYSVNYRGRQKIGMKNTNKKQRQVVLIRTHKRQHKPIFIYRYICMYLHVYDVQTNDFHLIVGVSIFENLLMSEKTILYIYSHECV